MKGNYTYSQRLALMKVKNAIDVITIFSTHEEIKAATQSAIKAILTEWRTVHQMARQIKWLQPSQKRVVKIYRLLCELREGQAPKNTLNAINAFVTKII